MIINQVLLDELTQKAKESPRLRYAFDLRSTANDHSQRMLNALEPGTIMPIHRHRNTTESCFVIRGALTEYIYDDNGALIETHRLSAGGDNVGISISIGQWHSIGEIESGTIIFESKDGAYTPLESIDILYLEQ